MNPGPKPTPSALRVILGNPGKRAINRDEPRPDLLPDSGIPEPPRKLSREARTEWDRQAEQLVKTRVLTAQDVSLLASYCTLHAAFVKAERKGELLTASLIAQYRALAESFGIGPAARTRIKTGGAQEKGKLSKFLQPKQA